MTCTHSTQRRWRSGESNWIAFELLCFAGLRNAWDHGRMCFRQFGRGEVQESLNIFSPFLRSDRGRDWFIAIFTDRRRLHGAQDLVACRRCIRWERLHLSRAPDVAEGDRESRFDCIQSVEMAHGALRLHCNVVIVPSIDWLSLFARNHYANENILSSRL